MRSGKSGFTTSRADDEVTQVAEVVDPKLPGKSSKRQVTNDRTPNRHRWSGREYQGA